jgi:mediator of RNA polymerase II transcription subunit 5
MLTEFRIIQNLVVAATAGFAPDTAGGMLNSFIAIADWILALLAFNPDAKAVDGSGEPDNGAPQHPEWLMGSADALAVFESLGILFAALAATEKGLNALVEMKNQGGISILALT